MSITNQSMRAHDRRDMLHAITASMSPMHPRLWREIRSEHAEIDAREITEAEPDDVSRLCVVAFGNLAAAADVTAAMANRAMHAADGHPAHSPWETAMALDRLLEDLQDRITVAQAAVTRAKRDQSPFLSQRTAATRPGSFTSPPQPGPGVTTTTSEPPGDDA